MTTQMKFDPNELVDKFVLVPILNSKGYRKVIRRVRALGFTIEVKDIRRTENNVLYFNEEKQAKVFSAWYLKIAKPDAKIEGLEILSNYQATYFTPQKINKAWKLLEQKEWIQGWYAKTNNGISVVADHPDACKFCTLGAIGRVYKSNEEEKIEKLERHIFETTGKFSIALWNDHTDRTKEEVIKTLKELDI